MKLEKDLMKQVKHYLSNRESTGEVIWYGRLNSLKVKTIFGGIVQGCPAGTPDWIAIVKAKAQYEIKVLFIECKSSKGLLRTSQKNFIKKYANKQNIHILVLREIGDLENWFTIHAYDFVQDLPSNLAQLC